MRVSKNEAADLARLAPAAGPGAAAVLGARPVPKPAHAATKAALPAAGGAFVVQMASVRSRTAAKAEWARFSKVHPRLLKGLSPDIRKAVIAGKGTFYRLRASGLTDKAAAVSLCKKLKASRLGCLVVRR